jgi:cytochrome c peroxidase
VFFHNGVFHTLQEVQDFCAFRDVQPGLIYPRKHDGTVEKYDDIPPCFRANIDIVAPVRPESGGQAGDDRAG